ncbi:hypothetical protein N9C63_00650 [bacterium]|nr:hypothetical protein [bacterium]
MKILTARNIVRKDQILLDVDILLDLPNRDDDSYNEYLKNVKNDLDKNGMLNPILVVEKKNYWNRFPWRDDSKKYGVVTGSNRYRYAVDNGYELIESIICTSRNQWLDLWNKTFFRVKSDLTNT